MRHWASRVIAGLCVAAVTFIFPATARDLTIGLKSIPTSVDPHADDTPNNTYIVMNMFDPLIRRDGNLNYSPALAESWEVVDPSTWKFNLRKGVKFTDGSELTSADVVGSIKRVKNPPEMIRSLGKYIGMITDVTAPDAYTVLVKTDGPSPALLQPLSTIMIISQKYLQSKMADFLNGKAVVGTGPYMFKRYDANNIVEMTRNPNYWDKARQPQWDNVTYRIMTNDGSRVAALLAGDVDLIESVPIQDVARLKTNPAVTVSSRLTTRTVYLVLDSTNGPLATNRLTGPNGEKLDKNPLADAKVREAIKLTVDLDALIDKVYLGYAKANGQFLLEGVAGFNEEMKPWKPNAARAKQLMEESGWAGKFKLGLVVSATTFNYAVPLTESWAQLLTRAGIPTTVEVLQPVALMEARRDNKAPMTIASYQNGNGSAEQLFTNLLHSNVKELGGTNYSKVDYSVSDKLVDEALMTLDAKKRTELFRAATKLAIEPNLVIPLFLLEEVTASRSNIRFETRADKHMYAADVYPK